jgi:hypothetical protein
LAGFRADSGRAKSDFLANTHLERCGVDDRLHRASLPPNQPQLPPQLFAGETVRFSELELKKQPRPQKSIYHRAKQMQKDINKQKNITFMCSTV